MARQPRPRQTSPRSSDSTTTSSSSTTSQSCQAEGSDADPPHTRRAVVFPIHGAPRSLILPWNDGDALFQRVAEAFDLQPHDVRDLHYMPHRPSDLALQNLQGLLLQRLFEPRPSTFLRLVLVDVETYEDDLLQPSAFQRFTKWLPQTLNRPSVLRMLDLEHIAEQYASQTRLWHNHCLIEDQQPEVLNIQDGDYIKVFIGDSTCENIRLSDVELPDLDLASSHTEDEDWNAFRDDQMALFQQFATLADELKLSPAYAQLPLQTCRVDVWQQTMATNYSIQADEPFDRRPDLPQERPGQLRRDASLQHIWAHSPTARTTAREDRVVPFDTWFLNSHDHPRCEIPRTVELPRDSTTWDELVIQAWQDLFDVRFAYRIVLVRPTSEPCQHAGHLLLLQREQPGDRGALISLFWHEETSEFDGRFARLLPRRLPFQRLLQYARLDQVCNERQLLCLGYQGHEHLDGISDVSPQTGNHFEIHAAPWEYLDSLNLFQQNLTMMRPKQQALESEPPGRHDEGHECARPHIETSNANLPPVITQSSFVQELFELWNQGAFAWENEERSARVVTYYVNHHDLFPRCDAGRVAHLGANYATWEETLRRTWLDRVQYGQPLDYFVVTPLPPRLEHGITAYILLVQNRRDLVTSLVSVIGTNGRLQGRSAVTTFEQVYDAHLIQALGLHQQCYGPRPILTCAIQFQDQQLLPGQPILARNGFGFVAHLQINFGQRVAVGRNLVQQHTLLSRSRVEDGSTTEEPLLSTVSSPVKCALPPPMDYAPEHVGAEPQHLQMVSDQPTHVERTPMPLWLPSWWSSLLQQLQEEGQTEHLEEGPVLYVLTWFLHGQQHRQCVAPRVLRLDQHWHRWWDDLKELWQDLFDASLPVEVGIVQPNPPLAPMRHHSVHLIVHQATMTESVCVITQLFHGQWRAALGQYARVMPSLLDATELLQQTQMQPFCTMEGRGCVVQHGSRHLHQGDPPFFLSDYASVVIHVDHPAFGPQQDAPDLRYDVSAEEHDEDSILQLPCERLTDRQVAHTCRPQRTADPRVISLESLLPLQEYQLASDYESVGEFSYQNSTVIELLRTSHQDMMIFIYLHMLRSQYPAQLIKSKQSLQPGATCAARSNSEDMNSLCASTSHGTLLIQKSTMCMDLSRDKIWIWRFSTPAQLAP